MGREITNSDLKYWIRCPEEYAPGRVFWKFGYVGLDLKGRVQGGNSFFGSHSHRINDYILVNKGGVLILIALISCTFAASFALTFAQITKVL